ncbi:hypothetical protein GCM10027614_82430 [Micromonospora vulcania]
MWKKRLTGADLDTNSRWRVAGTDLGIPYVLENGSIGYLFGDTFNTPWPEGRRCRTTGAHRSCCAPPSTRPRRAGWSSTAPHGSPATDARRS